MPPRPAIDCALTAVEVMVRRYHPMLGFGSFVSASRFCLAFDALRQYFRRGQHCGEEVSLAVQRKQFSERWHALMTEMAAA